MDDVKLQAEDKVDKEKKLPVTGKSEATEDKLQSKTSTASLAEQDLDTFLLGDLEDSDGGMSLFSELAFLFLL